LHELRKFRSGQNRLFVFAASCEQDVVAVESSAEV
jgi:hypothetical protein